MADAIPKKTRGETSQGKSSRRNFRVVLCESFQFLYNSIWNKNETIILNTIDIIPSFFQIYDIRPSISRKASEWIVSPEVALLFLLALYPRFDWPRKSHVADHGETQSTQSSRVPIMHRTGARPTASFYAFARFKEIYPLWIMPRFPVRWRASRVQYLRPLSSFFPAPG